MQETDIPYKSRSQKKRDSTALQKMGEELASLAPGTLEVLPLPPDLFAALADLRQMKNHEARRRQMQFVGRLMRELDNTEAIAAALQQIRAGKQLDTDNQHALEALREQLLQQDEPERDKAVAALLKQHPGMEEPRLRHLIQAAVAERAKKNSPKFSRELFRFLKKELDSVVK